MNWKKRLEEGEGGGTFYNLHLMLNTLDVGAYPIRPDYHNCGFFLLILFSNILLYGTLIFLTCVHATVCFCFTDWFPRVCHDFVHFLMTFSYVKLSFHAILNGFERTWRFRNMLAKKKKELIKALRASSNRCYLHEKRVDSIYSLLGHLIGGCDKVLRSIYVYVNVCVFLP